jgi:hypothetical protein
MEADQETRNHHDRLGDVLRPQGFTVRVVTSSSASPYLKVANAESPALNERIHAQQSSDGTWSYWWPWKQPIGSVDDLEAVSRKIAVVLRSVEGES